MKTEIIDLTPEYAEVLLRTNTINRVVRNAHVEYLANLMKKGEWKLTHQGIAIDKNGVFIDGQHRLLACILSGVTIKIMITTGLEPESFNAIDLNAKRGMHDILHLNKRAVSTISVLYNVLNGIYKPTPKQFEDCHKSVHVDLNLVLNNTGQARLFSTAPFTAAALLHQLIGNGSYSIPSLEKLSHSELEGLNDMLRCASKLHMNGNLCKSLRGWAYKREMLIKAFYILDPVNADKTRIRFNEDDVIARMRFIITTIGCLNEQI